MPEKKEPWEIGYSKENPPIPSPAEAKTANIEKPETLVGQMLDGRFLIEKDLTDGGADAGGIGLVYLAQDLKLLGKQVVVKILQKAALKNENIVRKFQHEKEALIRLTGQSGIVGILDSGTLSDGNPFMVLEFIEGYSLRRKLRDNGRLPLAECANLIEKIGNALSAVHSKKILHRDLKPENIMLTPQVDDFERVRLIDFGIARVEDSQLAPATDIPQAIGTILYMAPEQLEGKLEQTPAADIYAFALVAYEILTGELPFKPNSIIEMYSMQQAGVQTKPSHIRLELSDDADKIILQALALNPSDRPQDARQFGKDSAIALRQKSIPTNKIEPPINTSDKVVENALNKAAADKIINNKVNHKIAAPIEQTQPSPVLPIPPASMVSDYKIPNKMSDGIQSRKSKLPVYLGLGLLILAAIGSLIGFALWKNSQPSIPIVAESNDTANSNVAANSKTSTNSNTEKSDAPSRTLAFYLNVQKMRDGKPFEEPFRSSGQEIFENGYKFKMNMKADANGFIYLFNEEKEADGKTIYNILYPTPKTNNGSAQVSGNQPIETNFNTFDNIKGTEFVWLIWTAAKQDNLEAVRQSAFDGNGKVKDEANEKKLKDFLDKYQNEKTEISKETANQQTLIKGKGDIVIHKMELEHR